MANKEKQKSVFEKTADLSGQMTLDKFQKYIIRVIANQCYVRYWIDFGYMQSGQKVMAFSCINKNARIVEVLGIHSEGFMLFNREFYIIRRCKENGEPWTSYDYFNSLLSDDEPGKKLDTKTPE